MLHIASYFFAYICLSPQSINPCQTEKNCKTNQLNLKSKMYIGNKIDEAMQKIIQLKTYFTLSLNKISDKNYIFLNGLQLLNIVAFIIITILVFPSYFAQNLNKLY